MRQDQSDTQAQQTQQDSTRDEIDRLKALVATIYGAPTKLQIADVSAKWGEYTRMDPTAKALSVELPRATSTYIGQAIWIKNASDSARKITINAGGSDTIDDATSTFMAVPRMAMGFLCVEDGKWDTIARLQTSSDVMQTAGGGYAVRMVNDTGAATIKGTLVEASSSVKKGCSVAAAAAIDPIGVIFDAGVADGDSCWVVVIGLCQALMEDATDGTMNNWVGSSTTQAGRVDCTDASPPNATRHFEENGHCMETTTGAGDDVLCWISPHWN